ncbi:MAG: hypothetical protein ACOCP4_00130 [Candidatus Woesearchaeota archaeon]
MKTKDKVRSVKKDWFKFSEDEIFLKNNRKMNKKNNFKIKLTLREYNKLGKFKNLNSGRAIKKNSIIKIEKRIINQFVIFSLFLIIKLLFSIFNHYRKT